jgi:hypothetical protein
VGTWRYSVSRPCAAARSCTIPVFHSTCLPCQRPYPPRGASDRGRTGGKTGDFYSGAQHASRKIRLWKKSRGLAYVVRGRSTRFSAVYSIYLGILSGLFFKLVAFPYYRGPQGGDSTTLVIPSRWLSSPLFSRVSSLVSPSALLRNAFRIASSWF